MSVSPRDLLLNRLRVGLCEQVEEAAGVVVGVRVGVAQLIGDAVKEEVAALRVHVDCKVLEDVHVAAVGNATDTWAVTLGSDELDSLGAHIPGPNKGYFR